MGWLNDAYQCNDNLIIETARYLEHSTLQRVFLSYMLRFLKEPLLDLVTKRCYTKTVSMPKRLIRDFYTMSGVLCRGNFQLEALKTIVEHLIEERVISNLKFTKISPRFNYLTMLRRFVNRDIAS